MKKKEFININCLFKISQNTTFELFKKSDLYAGQVNNRFFWLPDFCEIEDISGKFKVGLCFKNNKITRVELFYVDEYISNETERSNKNNLILNELKSNYKLNCKSMENSFDKRNNYSSIVITF